MVLSVLFYLYNKDYPKVESLSLNVENIELYVDDNYELEINFKPKNAIEQIIKVFNTSLNHDYEIDDLYW